MNICWRGAALIDNNYSLPDPLKEFVSNFYATAKRLGRALGANAITGAIILLLGRGNDLHSMGIFPNRNDATGMPRRYQL